MAATSSTSDWRHCGANVPRASVREGLKQERLRFADANAPFIARVEATWIKVPIRFIHIRSGADGKVTADARYAQIKALNEAYAGCKIKFFQHSILELQRPASFTMSPESLAEKEIKQSIPFEENVLNFYTCMMEGLLGWATFPWEYASAKKLDGVVIRPDTLPGGRAPFDQGKTAVHEVGHWFGLYHTFQGGCNGTGDSVEDTVAHRGPNYGSNLNPTQPNGACDPTQCAPIDNFMNYTDDEIMVRFTTGQAHRINTLLTLYRPGLLPASKFRVPAAAPLVDVSAPVQAEASLSAVVLCRSFTVHAWGRGESLATAQAKARNKADRLMAQAQQDLQSRNGKSYIVVVDPPAESPVRQGRFSGNLACVPLTDEQIASIKGNYRVTLVRELWRRSAVLFQSCDDSSPSFVCAAWLKPGADAQQSVRITQRLFAYRPDEWTDPDRQDGSGEYADSVRVCESIDVTCEFFTDLLHYEQDYNKINANWYDASAEVLKKLSAKIAPEYKQQAKRWLHALAVDRIHRSSKPSVEAQRLGFDLPGRKAASSSIAAPSIAAAPAFPFVVTVNRNPDETLPLVYYTNYTTSLRIPNVPISERVFFSALQKTGRSIFLYVHGFNNTVGEVLARAANMQLWLNRMHPSKYIVVVFEWFSSVSLPSSSDIFGLIESHWISSVYKKDRTRAENAATGLEQLISKLSAIHPTYLLAHSMGNLIVKIASMYTTLAQSLVSLFMVASDVESSVYVDTNQRLSQLVRNTIVDCFNIGDKALLLSAIINKAERLGREDNPVLPKQSPCVPFDAGKYHQGWGHSYIDNSAFFNNAFAKYL